MSREDTDNLILAIALMAVAGYVDAVGFLRLGHLFVSFMSGDSTQFATSIARRDWSNAIAAGGIVLVFVVGVTGGRMISKAVGRWCRPVILGTELILLLAATSRPSLEPAVIVPAVLAMGIQNAAVHKVGVVQTGLTYVTGTLVRLGEKLADAFLEPGPTTRWAWLPYVLLWLGLVAGAIAGALGYANFHVRALLIPAVVLAVLALFTTSIAAKLRTDV
jgi:uncharacterized membrane protein YoaK (UPF0700 family)